MATVEVSELEGHEIEAEETETKVEEKPETKVEETKVEEKTETTEEKPEEKTEGKVFTQEELGRKLAEERDKIQQRYADYDSIKSERDSLKTSSQSLESENLRLKVAIDKRLPAQIVDRLKGSTREEIEADAESLLGVLKSGGANGSGFDSGAREQSGTGQTPDMASWLASNLTKKHS